MPIYEYQCLSCGKKTEQLQKLNDPPLAVCPTCGGELRKLISSPSFQFKGSGWYATDYAGKKGAGAGEGGGDATKPESKPEGTSEKSEKSEKPEKSEGGGGEKADAKPKEAPAAAPKASSD